MTITWTVPKLLARAVSGQAPTAARPIARLNRLQPAVRLLSVTPDSADTVRVAVQVGSTISRSDRDASGVPVQSGVYDLRLFRDSQLAGQWPNHPTSNQDLETWRRVHRVPLGPDGTAIVQFEHIKLPHQRQKVQFAAYAFNVDRVKSGASPALVYAVPPPAAKVQPRAFLITMGVNANESRWNLDVAVPSAESARTLIHAKLREHYSAVIDISLYSELAPDSDQVRKADATKARLCSVLDLLAGRTIGLALREEIDKQHQLQPATPDDAVVLYVASRGYADPEGDLYLIPYDTGTVFGITEEVLTGCRLRPREGSICRGAAAFLGHTISSSDLAEWWTGIRCRRDDHDLGFVSFRRCVWEGFSPRALGRSWLRAVELRQAHACLVGVAADTNRDGCVDHWRRRAHAARRSTGLDREVSSDRFIAAVAQSHRATVACATEDPIP